MRNDVLFFSMNNGKFISGKTNIRKYINWIAVENIPVFFDTSFNENVKALVIERCWIDILKNENEEKEDKLIRGFVAMHNVRDFDGAFLIIKQVIKTNVACIIMPSEQILRSILWHEVGHIKDKSGFNSNVEKEYTACKWAIDKAIKLGYFKIVLEVVMLAKYWYDSISITKPNYDKEFLMSNCPNFIAGTKIMEEFGWILNRYK